MIGIATAGKFGGSTIAARMTGLGWREASAIGILMNTRGLMELIVLNVGLDLGVISRTIFTMLVIMALVTTAATTPLLRRIYRRLDESQPRVPRPAGTRASGILVCVADAKTGPGLLTVAHALRAASGAPPRLVALHLQLSTDRASQVPGAPGAAGSPLGPLLARAGELGLEVEPVSFVGSDVSADLCRAAGVYDVEVVLLGAHRTLLLEGGLGGTAARVIGRSERTVAVLVDRGLAKVGRVLVVDSGTAEDAGALEVARRLALASGVELTTLRLAGHPAPVSAILEGAAHGHDLLVIGMTATWAGRSDLAVGGRRILDGWPGSILAVRGAKVTPPPPARGQVG